MNAESESEPKKSLRRSWRASSPTTKLTVVFAGIAALATFAYAGITGWQLYIMRGQLKALLDSNEVNRQSLYSVQRAFVTSQNMTAELATYTDIDKSGHPTKVVETTAHWENIGNTPAIGVITAFGSVQQQEELTEEEFIGLKESTALSTSTIGPKATLDSQTLRQQESWFIENPKVIWFYWGWMVYKDIFPNTKPHVTEFCWKVDEIKWKVASNGKRVGKPYFGASPCAHHNCVDEFCDDYATITNLASTISHK